LELGGQERAGVIETKKKERDVTEKEWKQRIERERERDGNKKEKRKKLVAKTNLKLANIYVKCAV
jgi:hypothetical protein